MATAPPQAWSVTSGLRYPSCIHRASAPLLPGFQCCRPGLSARRRTSTDDTGMGTHCRHQRTCIGPFWRGAARLSRLRAKETLDLYGPMGFLTDPCSLTQGTRGYSLALPSPIGTCLAWEGLCLWNSGWSEGLPKGFFLMILPASLLQAQYSESCKYTLVFCVLPKDGSILD